MAGLPVYTSSRAVSGRRVTYDSAFYDTIADGCRASAAVVVPVLVELLAPRRVVDVGCGEAHWLAEFKARGCQVIGVDGAHVRRERLAIDEAEFRVADLANPPEQPDRHDLCLSLEVAEHLPAASADRFVTALVRSAPIVVFSAAVPGQGGAGHLNEQWPTYWVELFARHGYLVTGALRWAFWQDARVENWYRQNLLLFAAPDAVLSPAARQLWDSPLAFPWPVVHPVLWDARRPR